MSKKNRKNKKLPKRRNAFAESLRNHPSIIFKDKREERGGTKNYFEEIMEEYYEDIEDEEEMLDSYYIEK